MFTLTWAHVETLAVCIAAASAVLMWWVDRGDKKQATDRAGLERGQKILFEKADAVVTELHAYKLHVAETYVNQGALEKALAPINESLREIRRDFQDARKPA